MLLTMALILALCSAWLEFKILNKVPLFKKLNRKSQLVGLGMSIGLSWMVGILFGATGLVVLIAGLLSTAMTEPVHAAFRYMETKNNEVTAKVHKAQAFAIEARDTYRPVGKAVKWTAIATTAPLWGPVIIRRKLIEKRQAA